MGSILWLIVINIMTIHIYGTQVPLWQLKPGDTLNVTTLKSTTAEYLGSVFNNYRHGWMLIQNDDFSSSYKINYKRKMCASLDSLKPLLYRGIYRGDDKLDVSGLNSSNTENLEYFDAFKNYLDESKYLFGLVQICRVIKTQTLAINLLESQDLPIVDGNIVYKIQKLPFGLLRFRRGFESHYVSSITTGNCLFQIYVNTIDICEDIPDRYYINKLTSFFYSPVFKSKITKINQDHHFETDPEFSNSDKSLYTSLSSFRDLMKNHNSRELILDLKLLPLPEAPKLSRSVFEYLDLRPGDVLDKYDFNRITSSLMSNTTADSVSLSAPQSTFSYSNCFDDDAFTESLIKSTNESFGYDYTLNLFDDMVKKNNYGVYAKYLTEDYKCYKVTVCSGLYKSIMSEIPTVKVISLDKYLGDGDECNIMHDDRFVMLLSNQTNLYYVSGMYFGNCLFQAQIFPSFTSIEDVRNRRQLPVYNGQIISASRNQTLENLIKRVVSNYDNSLANSILQIKDDFINISASIINMITDRVPIILELNVIN